MPEHKLSIKRDEQVIDYSNIQNNLKRKEILYNKLGIII